MEELGVGVILHRVRKVKDISITSGKKTAIAQSAELNSIELFLKKHRFLVFSRFVDVC